MGVGMLQIVRVLSFISCVYSQSLTDQIRACIELSLSLFMNDKRIYSNTRKRLHHQYLPPYGLI